MKYFKWLALLIGLIVLSQLALRLFDPQEPIDFVEYWAAGRLNVSGANPYDPEQLFSLQLSWGRQEYGPLMMWTPPWTLVAVMPFGLLEYAWSRTFWFLFQLGIVFACVSWIWRFYAGPRQWIWVAWLVGFSFGPVLHVLRGGQITPLLLLGVVWFLHFQKRQKGWLAGASLALVTVKPQLLYLFCIVLLLWALDRRQWSVLGGGAIALLVATALSSITNPALVSQYIYAVSSFPPVGWMTTTIGSVLRVQMGYDKFWLQLIAPILGMGWLLFYWQRNRLEWQWSEQMPLLVAVSVVTAIHAWMFDQTLLLLPLIQVALWMVSGRWSWSKGVLIILYLVVNGMAVLVSLPQLWFWWMAPWFLLWYLAASRLLKRNEAAI